MLSVLRLIIKILLPLAIGCGFFLSGKHLLDTAPEQTRRSNVAKPTQVDVLTSTLQDYQVYLSSGGIVEASRSTTLSTEVAGKIVQTSPNFVIGGIVKEGEQIARVDDADYQQALIIVQAELAQAQLALEQVEAERDQALRDRTLLGLATKPSKLALREPQINSSKAALAAAKARVNQARTQLNRTTIIAPYDGRITNKYAGLAQYVNSGSKLVDIVALDTAQVRLPLTDRQLQMLDSNASSPITFTTAATKTHSWQGKLNRKEGFVDANSLQQFVVADINDPFSIEQTDRPALTLGQFVSAQIEAKTLSDVWVIPRSAIKHTSTIQLIDEDNTLTSKSISVIWSDDHNIISRDPVIGTGRIVKTPVATAANGVRVQVAGEEPANQEPDLVQGTFKMRDFVKSLTEDKKQAFLALSQDKKREALALPADKRDAFIQSL